MRSLFAPDITWRRQKRQLGMRKIKDLPGNKRKKDRQSDRDRV